MPESLVDYATSEFTHCLLQGDRGRQRIADGMAEMGRLLNREENEVGPEEQRIVGWVVAGTKFVNSAAMFWVGLIDEVRETFPKCERIEMAASCPGRLKDECRWPQKAFERDLESLATADVGSVLREAVAEMELLGGPAPIALRLYEGAAELWTGTIPADCADADMFPYLVTWPLFWGDLPERDWNSEILSGRVEGQSVGGERVYDVGMELRNRHLSEDLYERVFVVDLG